MGMGGKVEIFVKNREIWLEDKSIRIKVVGVWVGYKEEFFKV